MSCVQTTSLGAYVLGALDTEDRQETERHLRKCPLCRDELVQLAPLPGLLSQVALADLDTTDTERWPDPAVTHPVGNRVAGRWPRARRVVGTAAAVAAAVAGILVAGSVVVDDASAPTATAPTTATWSTAGSGSIDARAVLFDRGWGTDITLTMDDLPAHQRCRLVVRSVDGRVETSGWWTTGYASTAEVPASTSIDLAAVDRLEVVRADGRVLAVLAPGPT